uniref:Putative RdRp n=1 Tax=Phakopsora tobravirus B TaxID=2592791 RepID=A0A7G3W8S5_9VIRU|nr:putative RdRp [Phakopsora tobravirus B]
MATVKEHDITVTLQELKEEFGLSDQEMEQFIAAEVTAGTSALRSAGVNLNMGLKVADSRSKVTKIPACFSGKLSGESQLDIKRMYPDFEITFTQEQHQAHAVAACCRMLDRMLLKKRIPAGQSILSVGGNYEYELLHSAEPVHSCTPHYSLVGDVKEAAREVQRMARLRGRIVHKDTSEAVRARIRGFMREPSPWRCEKLAQDCQHPADTVMVAHVYDMSLEQLVQTMLSHDSKLLLGCMILSNDMLVADKGDLPSVDGYYYHDGGYVYYGFKNEAQWQYKHRWAELRRFAFGGSVIQHAGRQAFYSITERRGDTIFYTITLAPIAVPQVPLKLEWKVGEAKRAVVNGFVLSDVNRTNPRRVLVPQQFSYPYESFVKSLSYATEKMEKGSFSLEDLQRKVRAIFSDMTINSVRVAGYEKLEDEQMAYFLANVGVLAALAVNKSAIAEHTVIGVVRELRASAEDKLVTKLSKTLSRVLHQPFPNSSPVHVYWSRFMTFLTEFPNEILGRINWEIDPGYRTAMSASGFRHADRRVTIASTGVNPEFKDQDVLGLLSSAAACSDEMALVLAEAAATVNPHPALLQWAANLRARFDLEVNEIARRADAEQMDRLQDPTLRNAAPEHGKLFEPSPRTGSSAHGTLVPPAESVRDKALASGVMLDDVDEVEEFSQDLETVNAVADAAIDEAVYLIRAEEQKILGECLKNFEQVTTNRLPDDIKVKVHGKLNFDPDFWLVDESGCLPGTSMYGIVVNSKDRFFPYAAVYVADSHTIVRVVAKCVDGVYSHYVLDTNGSPVSGLCMTTTNLEIFNGPVIVSNMEAAKQRSLPIGFKLVFVEGVPGCGKTHYIIHSVPADGVVIACGRENADTTRQRVVELAEQRRDVGLEHLAFKNPQRYIRTLDSALMRPSCGARSVMFLDECFQDHAGKFWACIKLWGVSAVQALGDSQQIPFIDRNATGKCTMPRLSHWNLRVGKYITRRCPKDATMAVAGFYNYCIRSTSQLTNSLSLELSTVMPPLLSGWKYLTMYQEDKATLKKRGYGEVNTVAEVQGQTYERVALVRLQERLQPLFNSEAQVDVALTRHTSAFIYYAPDSRGDLVEKLIKETKVNISLIDKYGDTASAGKRIFDV